MEQRDWQDIESMFKEKFCKLQDVTKFNDERCSYEYIPSKRDYKILAFFKLHLNEVFEKAWMYNQLNK